MPAGSPGWATSKPAAGPSPLGVEPHLNPHRPPERSTLWLSVVFHWRKRRRKSAIGTAVYRHKPLFAPPTCRRDGISYDVSIAVGLILSLTQPLR